MRAKVSPLPGRLRRIVAAKKSRPEKARAAAEAIRAASKYRWVGIYDVGQEEIVAIAWTGTAPPAFPRFPVTQGLCGAAAASGRTVLVNDVTSDPRYLTTFGNTRSEMVVPMTAASGLVLGLIDVESERPYAFSDTDRGLLERCALALRPLFSGPAG